MPRAARGTTHSGTFHVVDWYPTFCALAGVDGSDDPPVMPKPVDIQDPTKDIYGKRSWPPVDGIDIWQTILSGEQKPSRKYLWLAAQVMIKDGRYKLVTAQQEPNMTNSPPMSGWRRPDGTWIGNGKIDGNGCGLAFKNRDHFRPCLFDLWKDEREEHDLSSQMPELVEEIWAELNRSDLTAFLSRSPARLKGPCNSKCADAHWKKLYGREAEGPICGVPGCSGEELADTELVV